MESLKILLGMLALCGAAFAVGDVKNLQPTADSGCHCQEVVNSFCSLHFETENWFARFPNARGQDLTEALTEFLHFYRLLNMDNYCSHVLYNFLCFHYFPKCDPDRPQLGATPCRETCNEVWMACIDHARALSSGLDFPDHLRCSNFPSGASECSPRGESAQCGSQCTACPNASIHLEFATAPGETSFCGSEKTGSAEICLRLANVGSYDSNDTLEENVTVHLRLSNATAHAGVDFVDQSHTVVFPVGCRKGAIKCKQVIIINDSIDDLNEKFYVHANITSPETAKFGGSIQSSEGKIAVYIKDECPLPPTPIPCVSPTTPSVAPTGVVPTPTSSLVIVKTPTAAPDPTIPSLECKSASCNWRTRISGNTFNRNDYTFAALVQVLQCRGSVLEVKMVMCHDLTCGVCPSTPAIVKIAICPNCLPSICPVGQRLVVSGGHTESGTLYISNYKRKGLFAPVRSQWENFLPSCS